jgi:hypothetical protein
MRTCFAFYLSLTVSGSGGDRTRGLVIANDALSQTELPTRAQVGLYKKIDVVRRFYYKMIVLMRLFKTISISFLIAPIFIYILLDKNQFWGDACTYGALSIRLWLTLLNNPHEWFLKVFTAHPYRPPLVYAWGEFFVPVGHALGSIGTGLRLSILAASIASLFLTWRILKRLFENTTISFIGCLIMASAPLFISQSRLFRLEIPQLFITLCFINLMLTASDQDKISVWSKMAILGCLGLLIKISTPIFLIIPIFILLQKLFKKDSIPFETISYKHLLLGITALFLSIYTFAWYVTHLKREMVYFHKSYLLNDLPLSFMERISYWLSSIQDCFFFLPALIAIIIILQWSLKKRENLIKYSPLILYVSFLQILLFFVIQGTSTVGVHRFILPLLPYFILICSFAIAVCNNKIINALIICAFLFQFIFLHAFSFGLVNNRGAVSPFSNQAWIFPITNNLAVLSKKEKKEQAALVYELLSKINPKNKPTLLDVNFSRPNFLYQASCKAFPKPLKIRKFYCLVDLRKQFKNAEELKLKIKEINPVYYINAFNGKPSDVLDWIKNSGQYKLMQVPEFPSISVYKKSTREIWKK